MIIYSVDGHSTIPLQSLLKMNNYIDMISFVSLQDDHVSVVGAVAGNIFAASDIPELHLIENWCKTGADFDGLQQS